MKRIIKISFLMFLLLINIVIAQEEEVAMKVTRDMEFIAILDKIREYLE